MKVRHTKNGNVKLTLAPEQAEVVLARLCTSYQERLNLPEAAIRILDHIEEEMQNAGIFGSYQVSLTR